jgi:peroxiredoxin
MTEKCLRATSGLAQAGRVSLDSPFGLSNENISWTLQPTSPPAPSRLSVMRKRSHAIGNETKNKKMKKIILLSLLFSAYFSYGQRNTAKIPRVNDEAPDFTVQMINGETITLSDLRGQVVLLNFWGPGCPPCIKELRAFPSKIIEPFKNSAFVLLPISRVGNRVQVERTMTQLKKDGIDFNVGIDPRMAIFNLYARGGIPQNFVIDKNGIIRYASIGYTEEKLNEIVSVIKKLLEE